MAYQKKTWKNRQTEMPNRRKLTPVPNKEGVYDVSRDEGCVFDEGSAFDQVNMNNLELRIENAFGEVASGGIKVGRAATADTAAACTGNAATATVATSANAVAWGSVNAKPATFPPNAHTHDERYYTEGEVNNLINGRIPTGASCNKNWNWSGQNGQPSWLWGGNDPTNEYLYNPSNLNVNSANHLIGHYTGDGGYQPPNYFGVGLTLQMMNKIPDTSGVYYDVLICNSYISDVPCCNAIAMDKYGQKEVFLLQQDATATQWVNVGKFWHSGNDGSGSGLDADTVDGFHIAGKGTSRPSGLAENALYFVYE